MPVVRRQHRNSSKNPQNQLFIKQDHPGRPRSLLRSAMTRSKSVAPGPHVQAVFPPRDFGRCFFVRHFDSALKKRWLVKRPESGRIDFSFALGARQVGGLFISAFALTGFLYEPAIVRYKYPTSISSSATSGPIAFRNSGRPFCHNHKGPCATGGSTGRSQRPDDLIARREGV